MVDSYPALTALLPHVEPMILIDRVVDWQPDQITTEVVIHRDSHLFVDVRAAVPTYVSIEYMAQSVAALAGLEAHQAGRPIEVGFLLGTRKSHYTTPWLALGQRFNIKAERLYAEPDGLAVFACELLNEQGDSLASAQLNVFQPENAKEFVTGK